MEVLQLGYVLCENLLSIDNTVTILENEPSCLLEKHLIISLPSQVYIVIVYHLMQF